MSVHTCEHINHYLNNREVNMKRRIRKNRIAGCIIIILALVFQLIEAPHAVDAAAKSLKAPISVKAVSSSYNSITINWGGVSGATNYAVYRATSSTGSFKLRTTTTAKSFKDTGLATGNTYYYKIRAYITSGRTKTYGAYSVKVSARVIPSAPSSMKAVSSSYNSITVSWGGVTGASGYSVYRAKSSKGTYTLLAKMTGKSYKSSGLTAGTTYYYKVRAYRKVGSGIVYGNYTAIVNSKPVPSAPASIKAVLSSNNAITVSWGAVSGAGGYSIYRAASSKGTYTFLKTTTAKSYQNTGLAAGKSYYYKVRAYRTVGSSKIYSNYSSVVSAKTGGINVTSVSLDKSTYSLALGDTDMLKAVITPADATNKDVSWETSDNTIVDIDSTGKITAVSEGTAVITVTTKNGNKSATCTIVVNNEENTNPVEIKGIDVSKWQGSIRWASVKNSGVQFAMIRASYGSSSVDPMFETNYQQAKSNGIALGAYHYSYATTVEKAETEVNFFISMLKGKQFEYPVCIDVEDSSQSKLDKDTLTEIALTYLNELTKAGYYPIIYSNKDWLTEKLDDSKLTDIDHWLAEWSNSYSYEGRLGIWQYSSTGSVSGINGNVDLDISFVDYASKIMSMHLNGF
jgi:GH25 family lysozyme M1 (1,4-beta-N-acetylmuramidase)